MLPLLLRNLKQHFHLHPSSQLLDYRIHFPYVIIMNRGRCYIVQQARAQVGLTTILGFMCGKSLYCQLTSRFWGVVVRETSEATLEEINLQVLAAITA